MYISFYGTNNFTVILIPMNIYDRFVCSCGVVIPNALYPVRCSCGVVQETPSDSVLEQTKKLQKKKHKIKEPESKITTDCLHLGAKTEWEVACSCPASTKVPVYECAKNGHTTIVTVLKKNFKGLPILAPPTCCVICEHMLDGYEKRPRSDTEPSSEDKAG